MLRDEMVIRRNWWQIIRMQAKYWLGSQFMIFSQLHNPLGDGIRVSIRSAQVHSGGRGSRLGSTL